MSCRVCEHERRLDIEQDIITTGDVEMVAQKYGLTVLELKEHAIFHSSLNPAQGKEESCSIARKMQLCEADALNTVMNEYLNTLTNVGRRLNSYLINSPIREEESEDEKGGRGKKAPRFETILTKPVADLYINLGSEIRHTVQAIAELDRTLNGPKDDNIAGLAALAAAIRGSNG